MRPHDPRLLHRLDEVLLELAVGVGVGGELKVLAGINDVKGAEGHAAAEFGVVLLEGEWFAERGEAGGKVGKGFGGEVVAEVGGEERAVDLAVLEAVVEVEGLLFLWRGRIGGDDGSGEVGYGLRLRRRRPDW